MNVPLPFATITSITMTSRTGTGVGDTVSVGVTTGLGLSGIPIRYYGAGNNTTVYKVTINGADDSGFSLGEYYSMIIPSMLSAGDDIVVWYRGFR